jgi:hypothetical protein
MFGSGRQFGGLTRICLEGCQKKACQNALKKVSKQIFPFKQRRFKMEGTHLKSSTLSENFADLTLG